MARLRLGLARLVPHPLAHVLWLGAVGLGWALWLTYAPRWSVRLFPLWVLLPLVSLAGLAWANPLTFRPLRRPYFGLLFGLGAAFVLLEVFLRLVGLPPASALGAQTALFASYISDPALGHALKPNSRFTWTNSAEEFRVPIEINSLGLRDEPRHYARLEGTPRLLVLGDSFVEALQVPLEQTPTQIAQACLSAKAGRPVEVINAGLSANGTGQRWRYYLTYGRRFEADAVVLAVYPSNDLWDNNGALGGLARMRGVYRFALDAEGRVQSLYQPPTGDLLDSLADDWGLQTFAVWRAGRWLNGSAGGGRELYFDASLYDPTFPANLPDVWALQTALMRQLAEDVKADGAAFGLLLIPNWRAVTPPDPADYPPETDLAALDFEALHAAFRAFAAKEALPLLDLLQPARASREALYWEVDGHFNAAGYRLMGEALCAWAWETFSIWTAP